MSHSTGNKKVEIDGVSVYTAEDVVTAIQYGLDGVVISNHGGRQLDSVPATLDALRECAPVAKGKIKIAIDGGIRRGTDIFKALALGADFCFAGRVPIWGLAVTLSPTQIVIVSADKGISTMATKASNLRYSSCMRNSNWRWVWRGELTHCKLFVRRLLTNDWIPQMQKYRRNQPRPPVNLGE